MTCYRVVMVVERQGEVEDVTLSEHQDFGEALNRAWSLVQKKGIPASQVDILAQNMAGLWESIWSDIGPERGQVCAK